MCVRERKRERERERERFDTDTLFRCGVVGERGKLKREGSPKNDNFFLEGEDNLIEGGVD